jgi:aminoglycoside phosphotransferase
MSSKNYSYYPPNSPQFFFPKKEFKKHNRYYTPFSLKSKIFWFLYSHSSIIRSFFNIKEENIPLPISEIKKIVNLKNATFFYNIGTEGIEQKATIVVSNKIENRFIKFAQKEKARELVENESKTLLFLKEKAKLNSAKILNSHSSDSISYIITDLIDGEKVKITKINQQILSLVIQVSKLEQTNLDLKYTFSHGDFCPWNMLKNKQQEIVLIDWEMAGLKPLGYDFFTFIFQTNFLLKPNISIDKILHENSIYINKYFNNFQIKDWKKYLIKFAEIKVEKEKSSSLLYMKYNELLTKI